MFEIFFLESCALVGLDSSFLSNVFSYGAVEITNLETNKVLVINEHHLKPFYESWMIVFIVFVKLGELIYEE